MSKKDTFNIKKFQELLRKGIGIRTQKEFADITGITPATINRMLNNESIPCPKVSTLEILASCMRNVRLNELLEACGYESVSVTDKAEKVESLIEDGLNQKMSEYHQFASVNELCSYIGNTIGKDAVNPSVNGDIKPNLISIKIHWDYDVYECETNFDLSVYFGRDDSFIITKFNKGLTPKNDKIGEYSSGVNRYEKYRNSAEKRLLNCIFGEDEEFLVSYKAGFGFYYDSNIDFLNFLNIHADAFCDNKTNIELFKKAFEKDADLDDLFKDYVDPEYYGSGVGAVISDIMRKESGIGYHFYEEDVNLNSDEANACIMCDNKGKLGVVDKEIFSYVYECCKQLGVKKFGIVYYKEAIKVIKDMTFTTADFYGEL